MDLGTCRTSCGGPDKSVDGRASITGTSTGVTVTAIVDGEATIG